MAPLSIGQTLLMEFLVPSVLDEEFKESRNFGSSRFGRRLLSFIGKTFEVQLDGPLAEVRGTKVWTQIFAVDDFACTVRSFPTAKPETTLVTVTLEYPDAAEGLPDLAEAFRTEMLQFLNTTADLAPDQQTAVVFPAIRRGENVPTYYFTSDGRLVEFEVLGRPYNKRSKYQHVQIKETTDYGHALFLDESIQLAESDSVGYTRALMNLPKEERGYEDAEVLILGSGDGSLLYELLELEKPPKTVTMVDLDEAVLAGCGRHMRKACGRYLEQRKGKNFEVKVGDAVAFMKEGIEARKKYDYVFTDLTDMPVHAPESSSAAMQLWEFLCLVSNLAVQLVKPDVGKMMCHCNRKSLPQFVAKYESMINRLRLDSDPSYRPVYERRDSFVPSFFGTWVFFFVQMKKPDRN